MAAEGAAEGAATGAARKTVPKTARTAGGNKFGATWRTTACVVIPAAAAAWFAWTAGDGFNRIREDAARAAADDVAALPDAVRLMQAADGLGAAAARLIRAESRRALSAARTAVETHREALADHPALQTGPDAPTDSATRQAKDAAEKLEKLLEAADRTTARRLSALDGLPAARERLVVALGALDGRLAERRDALAALPRFHPDTQRELELHDEWRQTSRNLLGALLLTANAVDGQSGAAGAAAAHLNRLNDVAAAFPDSDFARNMRSRQEALSAAVVGPQGALTQLVALRDAQDETETLSAEIQRAALDLSQAGGDYVAAVRSRAGKRLTDVADVADGMRYDVVAGATAAFAAALLGAAYVSLGVFGRLRRLRRALRDNDADAMAALAAGDDEIAAAAGEADGLRRDIDKRGKALDTADERLAMAMTAADAAIWDENLTEGRVWWSPGYHRLLGYDLAELRPAPGAWETLVHPDDRAAAAEAAERCLAGLSDAYAATYRMRRKDGEWVWVEDRGMVKRDADGAAVRYVGMMRDAGKNRRTESVLRLARETAETESRADREALASLENRLRPSIRRLLGGLSRLESWALTDEQRRRVEEAKRDCQTVLDDLSSSGAGAGAGAGAENGDGGGNGGGPTTRDDGPA